jgi:hypothetical protein
MPQLVLGGLLEASHWVSGEGPAVRSSAASQDQLPAKRSLCMAPGTKPVVSSGLCLSTGTAIFMHAPVLST